jgi:nucleotide-binding universal stress UspA family protein
VDIMKLSEPTTKITLKNVLFTTDFSPVSETALHFAESIARRYGSMLTVAHAISPLETRMVPPEGWGACQQALDEAAREQMNDLDQRLGALPHEVFIGHGLVGEVISELIEKTDADLLVMGTHGRSGIGRLLIGSVAEEVFRQAPCPVLTIGPKVAAQAAREAEFKEIIFATGLNPESLAGPYALSLAQEFQARLTLVHIVPEHVEPGTYSERIMEARTRALRGLVPADAELWCHPEYTVKFGAPAAGILEAAAEKHADLIILGVRSAAGHIGAATHVVSATAHSVVSRAACPVLTVREHRA